MVIGFKIREKQSLRFRDPCIQKILKIDQYANQWLTDSPGIQNKILLLTTKSDGDSIVVFSGASKIFGISNSSWVI